jgi:hypothetical protein
LGCTIAFTSTLARRGKTIIPTIEKAITVMEANKKKRKKKVGLAKILKPEKWIVKATNGHVRCVIYIVNDRHIYILNATIGHFLCVSANLCY